MMACPEKVEVTGFDVRKLNRGQYYAFRSAQRRAVRADRGAHALAARTRRRRNSGG